MRLISNPLEYRFNLLFGSCGGSGGGCTAGGNTTALYNWVHKQTACTEINYCTTCGTMPSVVYIRGALPRGKGGLPLALQVNPTGSGTLRLGITHGW